MVNKKKQVFAEYIVESVAVVDTYSLVSDTVPGMLGLGYSLEWAAHNRAVAPEMVAAEVGKDFEVVADSYSLY